MVVLAVGKFCPGRKQLVGRTELGEALWPHTNPRMGHNSMAKAKHHAWLALTEMYSAAVPSKLT